MRRIVYLLVLVLLTRCVVEDEIPADVLPKEKMQDVLGGMVAAGEYVDGFVLKRDSLDSFGTRSRIYSQVLQVYKISREQFDRSFRFYREHPILMKELLDTLNKRLTTLPVVATPQLQPQPAIRDSGIR